MTIQTDAFLHKVTTDVGAIASGKTPAVHLIGHMPGVGLVSALREAAQTAEKELLGTAAIKHLDELVETTGPALAGQQPDIDAAVESLDDAQILVIDCTNSELNTDFQIQFLNSLLEDIGSRASVWLVVIDTPAFERGLKVDYEVMGLKYKSRLNDEMDGKGPANVVPLNPRPRQ